MLGAMTSSGHAPSSVRPGVVLVTAASTEGQNAVGDYSRRLCHGLQERGFPAVHVEHDDWSVVGFRQLLRRLGQLQADVVHLQHPQSVYGNALTPQLLSLLRPGVATLHEASRYGPVRGRARLLPFLVRSRRVVVTSGYERDYVLGFAPWARNRLNVIPLASNIPGRPGSEVPRSRRLVYFGSIRSDKGLETFIEVAMRVAGRVSGVECVVIGSPVRSSAEYARRLRAAHSGSPLLWLTGLDADAVGDELSRSRVAYLPFPDGASERRGSLLATLGCGLPTVTAGGRHTTSAIRWSVRLAENAEAAADEIERLLTDDAHWMEMSDRARRYAGQHTWDDVVQAHCALYESVWGRR
jgi:glycosyltransferase involved in cell wall biosynthesis